MMKTRKSQKLTFEELITFVAEWDVFFRRRHPGESKKERILARSVKLAEETGELASAVLASLGDQRAGKLARHSYAHLGEEMADVIIVTLTIAEALGIDMRDPLAKKMVKIKRRVKNW